MSQQWNPPLFPDDTTVARLIGTLRKAFSQLKQQLPGQLHRYNSRVMSAAGTINDDEELILGDTTGGNRTLTLPLAKDVPGRAFFVQKTVAANTLTVNGDTINGASSKAWTAQYEGHWFYSVQSATGTWTYAAF